MNEFPDFSTHGYQVVRELGHNSGGGRVTYLATRTSLTNSHPEGFLAVIKQFQFARAGSNWADCQSYQREIQILQQLNHPSIPRYLDSFETPTGFCLVQEYKQAPSLGQLRQWTPEEIKQIAAAVLEVLVYLQQQVPPVIHRDIKPENILVDRQEKLKVYLVDFGLARSGGGEVAVSSAVKGTLGFMPPEQLFNRQLTEASDLYSLGATLICLLTETKSSDIGNLIGEDYRMKFDKPVLQLEPRFAEWLKKMVAPNLKERFQNAERALQALERRESLPEKPAAAKMPVRGSKFKKVAAVLGIATLSFVAAYSTLIAIVSGSENQQLKSKISSLESDIHSLKYSRNIGINQALTSRQCVGCYLPLADLENAELEGADFRGAYLSYADLKDANLERANLGYAYLTGANLAGANLAGANLWGAKLVWANLEGAKLGSASLGYASLANVNLSGAHLEGASLWGADLGNAKLKDAKLGSANLKDAKLGSANLENADLTGANLVGAKLGNAKLLGASLERTDLTDSSLEGADLRGASLRGANLKGAYLRDANLRGANLRGANLWGANLRGAQLKGAIMPDGSIHP